ncbi:MAG: FAD-dependent monooxygenase [Acidiferrobacterales bacterium]|nr:FAD-dependent monooxygenase [Acidiferrobacterales bacterium]
MKILVVGAGPTGLALAADLYRRDIHCDIVEKDSKRASLSKALGVQSGVLRCFDATLGKDFTQRLIDAGRQVQRANVHIDDHPPITVDLSPIPGPYSFVLILEQSQTEELLESKLNQLGGEVQRGTEVVHINQHESEVNVRLNDGVEKRYDYVIGCDGAHSIVRDAMAATFKGGQYEATFSLGDIHVHWSYPMEIRAFIQSRGMLVFFPFEEDGRYRAIYFIKGDSRTGELDLDTFQREMREIADQAPSISNPRWMTRFKIHHRMVNNYRNKRLFLAGDAAHIHSPVGGQGMNLGIQDALSLSNKFSLLAKGIDKLDDYSRERIRVARAIVSTTDRLTSVGLRKDNWFVKFARNKILPHIVSKRFIQKRAAYAMSQIAWADEEIRRYV